ncbi:MAG: GNAT family N-acetyltransferase, partial [Candidatus Omnitrophota bacterium]
MHFVKSIKVTLVIVLLVAFCSNIISSAEDSASPFCLVPTLNTNPIQDVSTNLRDIYIPEIHDFSKIFKNKWAFIEISFLIARNLQNAISKHTVISDINNHLKQHSKKSEGKSEILLNGLGFNEIEELRENDELIGITLPIIRNGETLCSIQYSLKGDKTKDTVFALDDETNIYVRCLKNSEIFWKGIPRKEIKTILYPSFGKDARFLEDILSEFPYTEEVHLVDDCSQLGYAAPVLIERLYNQFQGNEHFAFAKLICLNYFSDEKNKDDILVLELQNIETLVKVKVFLHKYDFFHMNKIKGLENGADLAINKMPGFAGEHTTVNNVKWFRQLYKFTKKGKYVYATHSHLPVDPAVRRNLKTVQFDGEILSYKYEGEDIEEAPGVRFAQYVNQNGYVVYKKKDGITKETDRLTPEKDFGNKKFSVRVKPLTKPFAETHIDKLIALQNTIPHVNWVSSQLLRDRWNDGDYGRKNGDKIFLGKWEHSVVAVDGSGNPVGLLLAYERPADKEMEKVGKRCLYIHGFARDPKYKGMGIGAMMMTKVADNLLKKGYYHIEKDYDPILTVKFDADTLYLKKVYEELGFHCVGRKVTEYKEAKNHDDFIYAGRAIDVRKHSLKKIATIDEKGDKKSIAITGITGELGSSFSKVLFEQGHLLTALVQEDSGYKLTNIFNRTEIEKVKIEEGDLFSVEKLKTMILENNVFYHFAGIVGRKVDKTEEEIQATNGFMVGVIDKLIKNSNRADVIRFINASTYVVAGISEREDVKFWIKNAVTEFDKYMKEKKLEGNVEEELIGFSRSFLAKFKIPKGVNAYTISKLLGETFAFRMKNTVNCRLGNVYGPGCDRHNRVHNLILNRLSGETAKIPVEARDYVYIGDVERILAKLANETNPPKSFNLVTGQLTLLEEFISQLKKLTP